MLGMGISAFAQAVWAPAGGTPRIAIEVPFNIASGGLWIRYLLAGEGGSSATVTPRPGLRQYVIYRNPTQEAKIAIYARGCQFKAYTIPAGDYDVSVPFTCQSLPVTTLRGFLPPAQIPHSIFREDKLLIVGGLEDDWVCAFFLQGRGGSCLGNEIPLGIVGELDPAKKGAFEITIPDFTHDPQFQMPRSGRFGLIFLAVQDKTVRRTVGVIKPKNAGEKSGLAIQSAYPDPVKFTTLR